MRPSQKAFGLLLHAPKVLRTFGAKEHRCGRLTSPTPVRRSHRAFGPVLTKEQSPFGALRRRTGVLLCSTPVLHWSIPLWGNAPVVVRTGGRRESPTCAHSCTKKVLRTFLVLRSTCEGPFKALRMCDGRRELRSLLP